ncbi:MAG: hypothetical protein AAF556_00355 [Pseudomonadota bacterium]
MVKRITLILSDEQAEALEEAARLAERAPEQFAKEELVDLARTIRDAGTTDAVELARHRADDRSRTLEHFLAGGDGDKTIRDWGRNRAAASAALVGDAVPPDDAGDFGADRLRGHWPTAIDISGNGNPPPRRTRRTDPNGRPSGSGGGPGMGGKRS